MPTTTLRPQAPCNQTDPYGVNWKTFTTETTELSKNCSEGVPDALGLAFWKCNCENKLIDCAFETSQPNFTLCQSSGLINITESVRPLTTKTYELKQDIFITNSF